MVANGASGASGPAWGVVAAAGTAERACPHEGHGDDALLFSDGMHRYFADRRHFVRRVKRPSSCLPTAQRRQDPISRLWQNRCKTPCHPHVEVTGLRHQMRPSVRRNAAA
jgi:hypothetical protein